MEEKLLLANEITRVYGKIETHEELLSLAETLRVDQINVFDQKGLLLLSTMDSFDKWQTYEGHPIYDFMVSDQKSLIEDIRTSVVTGIQHKFGYFKLENGYIVQIGIQAEEIAKLFLDIDINSTLQEMIEDNDIVVAVLLMIKANR
jgi:hypothetical protein